MNVSEPFRWSIGRSLSSELTMLLTALVKYKQSAGSPPSSMAESLAIVPEDLRKELLDLLPTEGVEDFLETAADWAGVLNEEDYGRATLAIRALQPEDALRRRAVQVVRLGLTPDPRLPLPEQLVDLEQRTRQTLYQALGLTATPGGRHEIGNGAGIRLALRIISGGDLQHRFWLVLDRLFFECYRDYRARLINRLALLEQQAVEALGGRAGSREFPNLDWLPEQNVLRLHPEFSRRAADLGLEVIFWVEPWGLWDGWNVTPESLIVSCAQPGVLFDNFRSTAKRLANSVAALSDPTRLLILRLIRDFGLYNAEIASYLGLSRPTVSIHAGILREAGLISSRSEGRKLLHHAETAALKQLIEDLQAFLDLS